jgi:hypothetical protein
MNYTHYLILQLSNEGMKFAMHVAVDYKCPHYNFLVSTSLHYVLISTLPYTRRSIKLSFNGLLNLWENSTDPMSFTGPAFPNSMCGTVFSAASTVIA